MKFLRVTIVVLILLGVLFALGPRVEIDTTLNPQQIPADLSSYLNDSEQRFSDLKAGTEKTIIWANSQQMEETAISFVYVHGFSATRQESAPLGDRVATQLGGNLFYTRLTGHGRSDDALGESSVNAWINDTLEAITIGERISEEVVLMASSTGASLLTWLAANGHLSKEIRAMVFISPNFGPANTNSELLLWPWGKQLAQIVIGRYREWTPLNEQHAQYWTYRYPVEALLPMMGTVKLAREADVDTIQQSLLILYSEQDIVVNHTKTKRIFEEFGSQPKKMVAVETEHRWGHVLAGDILSPGTTDALAQTIIDFLIPVLDAPK
ncbi:lysophospholipase [Chloroflexi bacterium TSY]|nr:lysophospholipase [Chloroflexi bacterium TSY]